MRTPLHRTAIRPRYTHSHLSITRNKEGIMPVKSQPFLSSPSQSIITKRHKKIKDFFLLHIQWTIELLYKDNMSIVFCEMRRTMGVSGEMAVPVSRVLATMSQYSGWGITDINGAMSCQNIVTHRRSYKDRIIHTCIQQLILSISTIPVRYLCVFINERDELSQYHYKNHLFDLIWLIPGHQCFVSLSDTYQQV